MQRLIAFLVLSVAVLSAQGPPPYIGDPHRDLFSSNPAKRSEASEFIGHDLLNPDISQRIRYIRENLDSDSSLLMHLLRQSPNPEIRAAAIDALAWLDKSPVRQKKFGSITYTVLGTTGTHLPQDRPVPNLVAALKDQDAGVRSSAATALSLRDDLIDYDDADAPLVVSSLLKSMKDPNAQVRESAVSTLGVRTTIAGPAVPALLVATKDTNPQVRTAAIEALAKIRAKSGK
jgi:HEAT repeat protein